MLSRVRLFATPWTVACQAPPSMGFSRQVYWSELPFPSPGDLPDPEIKALSPSLAGGFFTMELSGKPHRRSALTQKLSSKKHRGFTSSSKRGKDTQGNIMKEAQHRDLGLGLGCISFWAPSSHNFGREMLNPGRNRCKFGIMCLLRRWNSTFS